MLVVVAVLLACGCKEKETQAARDIVTQAKDKTVEVAGNAKDKLGRATETALETAGQAFDRALVLGTRAKTELDKVYKTDKDYELAVDTVGSKEAEQHATRLDKMSSVEVKGVRVGYEEDSQRSLRGMTYAKHFRASWKRGDQVVRVSFYTKETLDLVAFAKLLHELVPAVEAVL